MIRMGRGWWFHAEQLGARPRVTRCGIAIIDVREIRGERFVRPSERCPVCTLREQADKPRPEAA